MKVPRIIPCVCIDHTPDNGERSTFGMPNLSVYKDSGKEYWSAFCPNCGRGSRDMDAKSSYLALKEWNRIQKICWRIECIDPFGPGFREKTEEWRKNQYAAFFGA